MDDRSRLADMQLSAPVWAWLGYAFTICALGVMTGSVSGFFVVCLASGLSFQFWTFASWRGMRVRGRGES